MMRGDACFADPVRELAGDAFGHTARVDEDERSAVAFDEFSQPVIDLVPNLGRHHGFERGGRYFELKVARTIVPAVYNQRTLAISTGAYQKIRDLIDWFLCGREPDPL